MRAVDRRPSAGDHQFQVVQLGVDPGSLPRDGDAVSGGLLGLLCAPGGDEVGTCQREVGQEVVGGTVGQRVHGCPLAAADAGDVLRP
jgi:hypothetical protein